MNTSIVTAETKLRMEEMLHNPWYAGFMAYCEGKQLDELPTMAEKRGWWAALDAQAGAEMPVKPVETKHILTVEEMDADNEDYHSDILDREFWARGGW